MMMTRSQIRLSDICELVSEPVQPGARPESTYIGLEHLSPGRLTVSGSGRAVEMRSTTSAFQSGDVLYGKLRPYLDKAALADTLGVCTTELLVLRAKAGVDPRYLALVVHSPEFVDYAVAGTTGVQHPRTSWAHISQFRTPAFSIGEQRKIAPLIWLVHDTIGQTSRAIGEGEKLGRAAMRVLFTRGLHREGQKETEIGMIPETWAFEQLGNIAAITYGAQAAVANATDPTIGIPILTNINLGLDGRINLKKKRYYRVPGKPERKAYFAERRSAFQLEEWERQARWESGLFRIRRRVYVLIVHSEVPMSRNCTTKVPVSVADIFASFWLLHSPKERFIDQLGL